MNQQQTIPGTAPKVELSTIRALGESLTYRTTRLEGTTTTLAAATLPNGFVVAIGMSACVSAANFDAQKGIDLAVSDAKAKAVDELWKLEGYALSKQLACAPQPTNWQQRLFAEGVEVGKRLQKLLSFMQCTVDLAEVDRDLMHAQASAMTVYLSVLSMRCKRAGLDTPF